APEIALEDAAAPDPHVELPVPRAHRVAPDLLHRAVLLGEGLPRARVEVVVREPRRGRAPEALPLDADRVDDVVDEPVLALADRGDLARRAPALDLRDAPHRPREDRARARVATQRRDDREREAVLLGDGAHDLAATDEREPLLGPCPDALGRDEHREDA